MKQTRILMGMPITIEVLDANVSDNLFDFIYAYFEYVDNKFSTYKTDSEISQINEGKMRKNKYSKNMIEVLNLCEITKRESAGFFNINNNGKIDPSGLVKGRSIFNASRLLKKLGYKNFYIDAGGDIQVSGKNAKGQNWIIGIQNPFNLEQIIKTLSIYDKGVATSGTYIRGQHVYNPNSHYSPLPDIVSLTLIGPNIYEADRFATAAFAMGKEGIKFIENLPGFEGYMIDNKKVATYTSNFERYVLAS